MEPRYSDFVDRTIAEHGLREEPAWIEPLRQLRPRMPRPFYLWLKRLRWRDGPEALRRRTQADREAGKTIVHILHVRKSGGTAVGHALRQAEHDSKYRLMIHSHAITLSDVPVGDRVVFFLRDPINRFVSGFNDRRRMGLPRYRTLWTRAEAEVFRYFATPQEVAAAIADPDPTTRRLGLKATNTIEHIRYHFEFWLGSVHELRRRAKDILLYGRQERLSEDFEKLTACLGISELSLPTDPKLAHRGAEGASRELSDQARQTLRELLADEYKILDFCEHEFKTTP